jgi:hypothetical protein
MRSDRKSSEKWSWLDGLDPFCAVCDLKGLAILLLAALLIGLVIWLVWWLLVGWRRKRRERRIEQGLCGECGYDLRASGARCPECGTPTPRPHASVRPLLATC